MSARLITATRYFSLCILWILFVPASSLAELPEPETEWTVNLGAQLDASPIAYPSENPNSVVIAEGGRVWRVDGSGKLIFDKSFGPPDSRGNIFDPSVADLDADGTEELIVGHNGGYVVAMDAADGSIIWEYDLGHRIGRWRSANPADLDGDGRPEILMTARDGWVRAIGPDGKLRWQSKIEEFRLGTPSVGDINNDGQPEIVYSSATRHVVALDADGRILWNTFAAPLHLGRTKPVIADLDGDGDAEIYAIASNIGPDTGLISLNGADGSIRWFGKTRHKAYMGRSVVQLSDGSRGILACDKANSIAAYAPSGTLRWRTNLSGHGVWTAPSVADVDGDGKLEIVATVRDTSPRGHAWYVLDVDGKILGAYSLPGGGGYGGSLVADIDGDGVLEIVMTSRSGQMTAFSFGGASGSQTVFSSGWTGLRYPPRKAGGQPQSRKESRSIKWQLALPEVHYGNNRFDLSVPAAIVNGDVGRLALEVETRAPNESRQIRAYRIASGQSSVEVEWAVRKAGPHALTLRLLDLDRNTILSVEKLQRKVMDLTAKIAAAKDTAVGKLGETIQAVFETAPDSTVALASRVAELEARFQLLAKRIGAADELTEAAGDRLAADIDAYFTRIKQIKSLASLTESEVAAKRTPSFVLWQDANPWDNTSLADTIPARGGPLEIDAWSFQNETESIAVNVLNLGSRGVSVRLEPGKLSGEGISKPANQAVKLHRVVRVPSNFGEVVPDVLPPLGEGYFVHVAPGEVEQIWLNISTRDLAPGDYVLKWPVRALDASSATTELAIRLQVSPVSLPERSRFAMGFWSRHYIGDLATVDDLNEHSQTIWYGLPLPPAKANAQGELVGEMDWSAHDAILTKIKQLDHLFYGGIPTPSFPAGVEVDEAVRLKARRNYLHAMVAHLGVHGLGWKDFMVYPRDEPGLFGTIEDYMAPAEANKKLDPRLQNYANPWGSITIDDIREMWPITDVWQPGMDTVYVLGKEYVEAMRAGGKPVYMYTPPGNARVLKPLGFYRAQPWLGFHWGVTGGGWWVYHGTDHWATHPDREPTYGGVASDGRAIVTTRRWEATRDGVEDYNVLALLRDWASGKNDAAAKSLLDEASGYVARTAFTGMPREAAEYDLDFARLMEYRQRIRAALERLRG